MQIVLAISFIIMLVFIIEDFVFGEVLWKTVSDIYVAIILAWLLVRIRRLARVRENDSSNAGTTREQEQQLPPPDE